MNLPPSNSNKERFSGGLRHYHRTGQPRRSWEEWVDGSPNEGKPPRNWMKIAAWGIGLMALGGIIAGLIIELR